MAIVDYFLKIEGIEGSSGDEMHKSAFEIKDFSFGVENPTTIGSATGGAGAGKAKFSEFQITKTTDKASPVFFKSCATGTHYKKAELFMRKAGGEPLANDFMKVTFTDVLISSYRQSARPSPTTPPPPVDVAFVAPVDVITNQVGTSGQLDEPQDAIGLSYAKLSMVSGAPQRIPVRSTAGGTLTFDAKTNTVTVGDWNGDGVAVVGNVAGNTTRAVQEFDVKVLIGLLTAPFSTARLRLLINEVRDPAQPPGEIIAALARGEERQGPSPHMRFDVLLYGDADGVVDASDLTRPGRRVGQLLVDPSDPNSLASLNLDLGAILLKLGDDTFGIRIQLHGAGLPEPFESGPGDEGPEERVEGSRNVSASFTMALVLDTAT